MANREWKLRQCIGPLLILQWCWFYSEVEDHLLPLEGGCCWTIYTKIPSGVGHLQSKKFHQQFGFDIDLLSDAQPILVSRKDLKIQITSIGSFDSDGIWHHIYPQP
jgi:hypothetical protein